jgi:hypothetical protein
MAFDRYMAICNPLLSQQQNVQEDVHSPHCVSLLIWSAHRPDGDHVDLQPGLLWLQ